MQRLSQGSASAAAEGRARVGWLVQAVAVATGSDDGGGLGWRQLRLLKTRARLWIACGREWLCRLGKVSYWKQGSTLAGALRRLLRGGDEVNEKPTPPPPPPLIL